VGTSREGCQDPLDELRANGSFESSKRLGSRNLVCFNKAIFAKQYWRILKNPTSPTAQIIAKKYYPQSSIMGVTLGKKPSFAWRSLMSTCDVLKNGLCMESGR
jgi:hypothetical protein